MEEWEPKVRAWVIVDRDRAMKQAHALDDELKIGRRSRAAPRNSDRHQGHHRRRGPAHGLRRRSDGPIDVATDDAEVVANLRTAGAVIMGKTVTTPYAWIDPPVTRNPWNLERTPGGSSSGSAAAVACGMCLAAIGTQTGGSITRPASFCGVAGMKPFVDLDEHERCRSLCPSLDHIGPIAPTVADLRIVFDAICTTENFLDRLALQSNGPPRLGRLRGFFDRRADSSARSTFDSAVEALQKSVVLTSLIWMIPSISSRYSRTIAASWLRKPRLLIPTGSTPTRMIILPALRN